MPSLLRPLPCDAELLSAYRDGALDPLARHLLETHLRACPGCRQELADYHRLAELVKALPLPVPPGRLSADLAGRVHETPRRTVRRLLPVEAIAAGVLLAFVVTALLFHAMPAQTTAVFAAYPPPGANDVSTDTAVRVTFPAPVDRQRFLASIHFEPPVAFDVVWESAKQAELIPVAPLDPDATYALVYDAPATTTPTDQAAHKLTVFRTAPKSPEEGGPTPAVSRAALIARAQSIAEPIATPARATTRAAANVPVADRSPSPDVVASAVPVKATMIPANMAAPTVTSGPKAGEVRDTSSLPARRQPAPTSTPTASAPAPSASPLPSLGAAGTPKAAAAVASGTPAHAPAPSPNASAAASAAVSTRTGLSIPVATSSGVTPASTSSARSTVATASATAAPSGCAMVPQRGFGLVYRGRPDVQSALGCATAPESPVTVHSQIFQRGILLTLPSQRLLYQFGADASWQAVTSGSGEQGPAAAVPGATLTPGSTAGSDGAGPAFLAYWDSHPALRAAFGVALGPEQSSGGTVQAFANGQMLWIPGWVFVLEDGGRWLRFVDAWSPDAAPDAPPSANGPTEDDALSPGSTFRTLGAAPPLTSRADAPTGAQPSASAQVSCAPAALEGLWQRAERLGMPLGCPSGMAQAVGLVIQPFERGTLLWRADTAQIVALFPDGRSAVFADHWRVGDPVSAPGDVPPQGFFAPVRGFGLLWRNTPALRERLGWALRPEEGVAGTLLPTSGGLVLEAGPAAYALAPSGAWTSFLIAGRP